MGIIKEGNINSYINKTESQPLSELRKQTEFNRKTTDYFDYLYSYPPKIQIKWNTLDELNEDLFIGTNYGVLEHSVPFIDFLEDWFFNEASEEAVAQNYPISKYFTGFVEKINSSNFFLKKTKKLQAALVNVPVYAVLNGQGEIVLSKPSNFLGSKTLTNYIKGQLYDTCGSFDPSVEKKSELGLFFMNKLDAEKYLKEVARSDFEGTQTVGLSLHCISLNSAYKITREHHPGIDFRFVPNFTEVKNMLTKDMGKADMIIEDEQQQLRFRRRGHNLFPYLKKLGLWLSPGSSFLQRNEYFKGVPIYIVQVQKNPRNFLVEQYFNTVGILDTFYNRCIQAFDSTIGFGHNWIMQGSLQDAKDSDQVENYIFFEKTQALKFSKKNGRKVARYKGGRTSNLEFMVRKPKIFIYNLEDFLEDWEDNVLNDLSENAKCVKTLFNGQNTYVISPSEKGEMIDFAQDYQKTPLKEFSQSLNIKFRVLKRAIGVFFSTN